MVGVVIINDVPFLPYIYALLRSALEFDAATASHYSFMEPIFISESVDNMVRKLVRADVLALSCYVWNFNRQMKVARLCKAQNPRLLVVAGGPHIPERSEELFETHPYVDIAVHGEGELTFRDVLREYCTERPSWGNVAGISYSVSGHVYKTVRRPKAISRDIPIGIYHRGLLNESILLCKRQGLRFYAPFETNRGCPYSCTFCDWGANTMSNVRQFDLDELLKDIEFFSQAEVSNVFICDANFGMLPRDVEIAKALAQCHGRSGFPQQVRVNFAKNSNDRVYQISRLWADHEMLMGTTLSIQSNSADVLKAIRRDNIGTARYNELKLRYSASGIHTYTELILGLPEESKQSFIKGIGDLLEAGNHDDLRVYEFDLLPNAPVNDPSQLTQFGIRTMAKQMYLVPSNTPLDERERVQLVIETNTLTTSDWISCAIFSQLIQFLHNGCYTRYIAIHARRYHNVSYQSLYEHLQGFFAVRPDTVLGAIIERLAKLYSDYLANPDIPQVNLVASQPDMLETLGRYGRRKGWTVADWAWLKINQGLKQFSEELRDAVQAFGIPIDELTSEVLKFQLDIILTEQYDPKVGKVGDYKFKLPDYFVGGRLEATRTRIHYRDSRMGVNRQYFLKVMDAKAFAKAAVGESYPFVRIRHYQHQLLAAEITFPDHVQNTIYETSLCKSQLIKMKHFAETASSN